MKIFLLTVLTTFFISSAKGQVLYSLEPVSADTSRLVSDKFKIKAQLVGQPDSDTLRVDVFNVQNKKVLIQNYLAINGIVTNYIDSVHQDTTQKQTKNAGQYQVKLFKMTNGQEEELSQLRVVIEEDKKSKLRKTAFKLGGSIKNETYVASDSFDYQFVPLQYNRSQVDLQLSIKELPFNAGFFYTTESNMIDINSFYLSFDYNKYRSQLAEKLKTKELDKLSEQGRQIKDGQYNVQSIEKETFQVENKLKSPEYQEKLAISKKEVALAQNDTLLNKSYRYKKAVKILVADSLQRMRLKELDAQKQRLKVEQEKNRIYHYRSLNLNNDKAFAQALKDNKLNSGLGDLLTGLKRMEVGTIHPAYNNLMFIGVQLRGINVEYNKYGVYAATFTGKVRAGIIGLNSDRHQVIGSRVGFKNEKNSSLIFSYMKASAGNTTASNEKGINTSIDKNELLGVEGTYGLGKYVSLRSEMAFSNQSSSIGLTPNNTLGFQDNLNRNNAAFLAGARVNIKQVGSVVDFSFQQVGANYYAVTAPNLRRDNQRFEGKMDQRIYKSAVNMFASCRVDLDNVSNLKNSSTQSYLYTLGVRLFVKRFPYLIASISPFRQYFTIYGSNAKAVNKVNMYNITVGYIYANKAINNNSVMNHSRNNTFTYQGVDIEATNLLNTSWLVSNTLTINAIGLATTTSLSKFSNVVSFTADSIQTKQVTSAEIMLNKSLKKIRSNAEAGYTYIADGFGNSYRHVMKAGWSMLLLKGLQTSFRYEYHLVNKEQINTIHVYRLSIVKTF